MTEFASRLKIMQANLVSSAGAHGNGMSGNVVFILPRLHSNQLGWFEGLRKLGLNVSALVLRVNPLEDHESVWVQTIDFQELSPKSRATDQWTFSRFDRPVTRVLAESLENLRADTVVIRADLSLLAYASLGVCRRLRVAPIMYTQTPLRPDNMARSEVLLRRQAFRRGRPSWVTPVERRLSFPKNGTPSSSIFERTSFLPFAVPDGRSDTTRSECAGAFRFICVSKFRRRKGIIELLREIETLLQSSSTSLSVVVVGQCLNDEEREVLNECQRIVRERGLDDIVTLRWNLSHLDTLREIELSDCLVLNAQHEPASVSNVEALARGVPVIIGFDNGTAHYVSDLEAGSVVDYQQGALSHAMAQMMKSDVLATLKANADASKLVFSSDQAAANWRSILIDQGRVS